MSVQSFSEFSSAQPYFDAIRNAIGELGDGDHFFDLITADTIYEVLYNLPGWPRIIKGQRALMSAFRGYVAHIHLSSVDNVRVNKADDGATIVVEYEVHGTILSNQATYDNRFCSIISIRDRKITQWRDYMDSLAAWEAITRQA